MKPLWLPNLLTVLRCFAAVGVAVCLWLLLWPMTGAASTAQDGPSAIESGRFERLLASQTGASSEVGESPRTLGEMLAAEGGDPDDLPPHLRDFRPETGSDGLVLPADVIAELERLEKRQTGFLFERTRIIPAISLGDQPSHPLAILALALFIFAAVSDFLDGFLARRWNAQSDFGRLLDPIADKLLVGLPFLVMSVLLIRTGDWPVMLFVALPMLAIIFRDLAVTALRFSPRGGAKVEVAVLSKWKTALEMIVLGFLLTALALSLPASTATAVTWLAGLWAAAVVSVYTGYRYFRAAYA